MVGRQLRAVSARAVDAWWARIVLVATLIAACFMVLAPIACAQSPLVQYEYVLLIDTSGSMSGHGPGHPHNIFPKVKSAVDNFIASLDLGNSVVYIYPFDVGLGKTKVVHLRTAGDKTRAEQYVNGLVANGATTAIYDSLAKTLAEMRRARLARPGRTHVQTILLFTDGREEVRPMALNGLIAQFRLARGENPFLFLKYVTLGTQADPAWSSVDGVDVVTNPPGTLQKLLSIRVLPAILDFGSLHSVNQASRVVEIAFDKSLEGADISLTAKSPSVEAAGGLMSVQPATIHLRGSPGPSGSDMMRQSITLGVDNRQSLDQKASYSGQLALALSGKGLVTFSPPALDVRFTLAAQPTIAVEAVRGSLNGNIGTLDPYSNGSTATRSIRAVFNNQAEQSGSFVTVRLAHLTGPDDGSIQLSGGSAASENEVKLTPQQPQCALTIRARRGQTAGAYAYNLTFEPSGAALSGVPLDPKTGLGTLMVRFSVPTSPPPLWATVVRWVAWGLLAVLVLAVIAFVVMCMITGSSPGRLASLLVRKLRPSFQDARVDVTKPYGAAGQFELSGERSMAVGPMRPNLELMPFTLRFEPHVSIVDANDTATVRVEPEGSGHFTLVHAATGDSETTSSAALVSEDVVRVDGSDGLTKYELLFSSYAYVAE